MWIWRLSALLILDRGQLGRSLTCAWRLQAVKAAVQTWGSKALAEQQAEDRLAFACEKAPTSDPVTSKLREAFQVSYLAVLCTQHVQPGLSGLESGQV